MSVPSTESSNSLSACPNCGSDQWKSAKMVVLEGTSMSDGKIEGSVRDKGMFGGGVRSFLLSDRWFSWDYDLRADINIVSMTALVENVKKFLVSQGEMLPLPKEPEPPKRIGFLKRVTPRKPSKPSDSPTLPTEPTPPTDKPWYVHFLPGAAVMLIMLTWLTVQTGAQGLLTYIFPFCLFIQFIDSFSANRKARAQYEKDAAEYPGRASQSYEAHAKVLENYQRDMVEYHRDVERAGAQAAFEAEEDGRFARESAAFEQEKQKVALYREMLWERCCVCSRCSTTYLPHHLASPSRIESGGSPVVVPQIKQAVIAPWAPTQVSGDSEA